MCLRGHNFRHPVDKTSCMSGVLVLPLAINATHAKSAPGTTLVVGEGSVDVGAGRSSLTILASREPCLPYE